MSRDFQYVRYSAVPILAGIYLRTGQLRASVEDRHRSREFIGLLSAIDAPYPPEATLRIIMYNHSAHTSKETKGLPRHTHLGRFDYVHTPKHGSWRNLIGYASSKMAQYQTNLF